MNKLFVIVIIFLLVISTTMIKNTTKKIEDEIYSAEENIRLLENEYKYILLENSYLSSSEQLLKFQELFFEDSLTKISIDNLRIMNFSSKKIDIKKIKFK